MRWSKPFGSEHLYARATQSVHQIHKSLCHFPVQPFVDLQRAYKGKHSQLDF